MKESPEPRGWGRRSTGGLLKESPRPPRTFLEFVITPGFSPLRAREAPPHPRAARVQLPGDARGEAPCIKNNLGLPLPAGKGVGGMGERKHTKGSVRQAAKQASPLPGTTAACRDNRRVFSTETGASRGSLNDSFGKSSEGFGGLFQESPGVSPASPGDFLFAPQKKACNFRKNVL